MLTLERTNFSMWCWFWYITCRLGLETSQWGGFRGDNGRVTQSVLCRQRRPLVHLRLWRDSASCLHLSYTSAQTDDGFLGRAWTCWDSSGKVLVVPASRRTVCRHSCDNPLSTCLLMLTRSFPACPGLSSVISKSLNNLSSAHTLSLPKPDTMVCFLLHWLICWLLSWRQHEAAHCLPFSRVIVSAG